MKRSLRRLMSVAVTFPLIAFVLAIAPAPALATCNSNSGRIGVDTGGDTQAHGTTGWISNYKPRVPCGAVKSFVMLDWSEDSTGSDFAQMGWGRGLPGATGTWVYFQYSGAYDDNGPQVVYSDPNPDDTTKYHKYSLWTHSGQMTFTLDDIGVFTQGYADWESSADESSWIGKVQNDQDQVPGDTNHEEKFHSLVRLNDSGNWVHVNALSNKVNSTTNGHGNWADDDHFLVWDGRYSNEP